MLLAGTAALGLAGDLSGKGEVNVFGGGMWFSDGIGNKPYYGAAVGGGVTSKTLLFGEFTHSPLETGGPVGVHLIDFQGGVKQNLITSDRVEPYITLAAGYGRFFLTGVEGITSNHFGLHGGLGARIYASPRWGIQPEVKYSKYFNDGGHTVRYGGGIFFQW